MIISTKRGTPAAELDKIIREFEAKGLSVTMIRGTDYNVFGLVGDTTVIDEKQVRANPYVENVQRVSEPYKKANRLFHEADSIIDVGGIKVGGSEKIAVIGGPCSIESEEQAVRIAREVKDAGGCMLRGGAYKPRTSPYDFSGLGAEGGGHIVQIPYLIPLVCSEGHRFSEKSLHLHIGRGHQCAGYSFEINGFLPLIDVESENLRSIYSFCPASA